MYCSGSADSIALRTVGREPTLNTIGAFSVKPRLKLTLGQKANHLDFRNIIDQGKILPLDLGHSDGETRNLLQSLDD